MIIDWQSEYESVIRTIGSATYGKERWFYQDNGIWYDRKEGDHIDFFTLESRIYEAGEEVKPNKGRWDFIGDNMFRCTKCGAVYTTRQFESMKQRTTDPIVSRFCPRCGAENG